ncbi:hypothetical protein C7475_101881 [Chitinophaga sp. S165]|nr:hypothetical protein C7475_101881 [Chitinophaga sp. S165]
MVIYEVGHWVSDYVGHKGSEEKIRLNLEGQVYWLTDSILKKDYGTCW